MGYLVYAGSTSYEFDDRLLAHVRAVVVSKLRQHQHFELSWAVEAQDGSGRVSLALDPGVPLEFNFRSKSPVRLNPRWVQAMVDAANSPRGLFLMTEEAAEQSPAAVDA